MKKYFDILNKTVKFALKKRINKGNFLQYSSVTLVVILLTQFWFRGGFDSIYLDTDLGRDLGDMSALWTGQKIIWLGPRLRPGLHASPVFYYIFYFAIWISRGNAQSVVIMNLMLSAFFLLFYGLLSAKKHGSKSLIAIIVLGLAPWWLSFAMHPGNGYTYVAWLFLALTLIWFEFPFFLSALILGLSTAYHPAAIIALVFLIYDWWSRDRTFRQLIIIGVFLVLPWAPIIAFEYITKGYLIKHFLAQPSSQINWGWSTGNLIQISLNQGISLSVATILWIYTGVVSIFSKKLRFWFLASTLLLFIFGFSPLMRFHYLLGISCILLFVMVQILIQERIGVLVLTGFSIWLLFQNYLYKPIPKKAERTISKIDNVVVSLDKSKRLNKTDKYAVIAVLDETAKVPHADDYRFFLRVKGYQVVDSQHFPEAEKLIMFVEASKFDWANWSNFDIEQFGKKKVESKMTIDGIRIIIFTNE